MMVKGRCGQSNFRVTLPKILRTLESTGLGLCALAMVGCATASVVVERIAPVKETIPSLIENSAVLGNDDGSAAQNGSAQPFMPIAVGGRSGSESGGGPAPFPSEFKEGVAVALSSTSVVAGTIVLVKVALEPAVWDNQPDPVVTGSFEKIKLPFYRLSDTDRHSQLNAVLGVPYLRKPGPGLVQVEVKSDGKIQKFKISFDIVDGNYPSEILHVDGRRVNPQKKADIRRIVREQSEIGKIYRHLTTIKYWSGPFLLPLNSRITSGFGNRRVYNGALKNFHPGMDFKAAIGTPIYASARGKIVMAKNLFYTGNTVMIDHGFGIITIYAHMSAFNVKEGQIVEAHTLLGLSGKTGRVNGPHLHWQTVIHQTKVNPMGLGAGRAVKSFVYLSIPLLLYASVTPLWAARDGLVTSDEAEIFEAPSRSAAVTEKVPKNSHLAASNFPIAGFHKIRTDAGVIGWIALENLALKPAPSQDEINQAIQKLGITSTDGFSAPQATSGDGGAPPGLPGASGPAGGGSSGPLTRIGASGPLNSKKSKGQNLFSSISLRGFADLNFFSISNAIPGYTIANGISMGAEILFKVGSSTSFVIRGATLTKTTTINFSDLQQNYSVDLTSTPILVGLEFQLIDTRTFSLGLGVLPGVAFNTQLVSTDTSASTSDGNVSTFNTSPLTGLIDLTAHLKFNSYISVFVEAGYLIMQPATVTNSTAETTLGAAIFNSTFTIDLSGPVAGLGVAVNF